MSAASPAARRVTLILLALACGLAAIVAVQVRPGPATMPPARAVGEAGGAQDDGQVAPPSIAGPGALDSYAEVAARPLFLPTRRPLAEAAASPARGPLPRLKGVVLNEDLSAALFEVAGQAAYALVPVGERFGAWRLETVAPDHVVLSHGGEVRVIDLEDLAGAPGARPDRPPSGTGAGRDAPASRDDAPEE